MKWTIRKLQIAKLGAVIMLLVLFMSIAAAPVAAAGIWGQSVNVLSLPSSGGARYSSHMGSWDASYVPGVTFTDGQVSDVTTANLANYDTVLMYGSNPNNLNAQQKADLVQWVFNGGKLILLPGEDAWNAGWDYSWLPFPIDLNIPGAQGAQGALTIVENSKLTQDASGNPIDVNALSWQTDAVGDADVMVSLSTGWCAAMTAQNVNGVTGPVEAYSKIGDGIIIFNGLDWDYLSWSGDLTLQQVFRNMFDVSSLLCGTPWSGNLEVTKTADKPSYSVGDTITFTVSVKNLNPVSVENGQWTDTPPAEIEMTTTSGPLPTLAPAGQTGDSTTFTLTATAKTEGLGLKNSVTATGEYAGIELSGSADALFDIKISNQPPVVTGAYSSVNCLWPPNHKFVDGQVLNVTDPNGDPVTITITGITSDEATATDIGAGGATHSPDAKGVGTSAFAVRSECSGDLDGRVYVIHFTASDGKPNGVSTGTVEVCVPHDQSKPKEPCKAVNSGQNYDATAIN